jgi:hypothetical protein
MIIEGSNLVLGDEFTYQFCDKISQICGNFQIIPETQIIVLDYNGFCKIVAEADMIVDSISSNMLISRQSGV